MTPFGHGDRPGVRVNQLGYVPGRPMRATLVTEDNGPVEFELRDRDGGLVFTGRSFPWPVRPEPTSGLSVHVLDFTGAPGWGPGHVLLAGGQRSHPFTIEGALYRELASDALRFFYLLRSGAAISDEVAPGYGRPAGHVGRPPNQGDVEVPAWQGSEAAQLYPGWRDEGRYDVSGGWYDAGDYGKYVTSGGIALWQLLSTLDLPLAAEPDLGCLAQALREECRWELDWMLRMQVSAGAPLAGLVFHRVHGTEWSPIPCWPHEDPTTRVLHRPSTSATLHVAAVAAQAARLFRSSDQAYAEELLTAARRAHAAAARRPRLLAPDDHARFGGGPYGDDNPDDDFYWAAAELWLTTGEPAYADEVRRSAQHHVAVFDPGGFDFDRVAAPARLDLALLGTGLSDHDRVWMSVQAGADRLLDLQERQPWGQPYAPAEGWDWGSNGRILNNLVVLASAHRLTGDQRYRDAVFTGIDYLLGRNALGQSYVTGYGTDFSRHQRTRQFGHDLDPAFPLSPLGALAGGPNSRPHPDFPYDQRLIGLPPQCCYLDEPTSEVTNDVCIRWNAPLVFLATYLHLNRSVQA
jgi:endoglucanase